MPRADRIQYGCGFSSAPGWRNFDGSPTLRFERLPVLGRLYVKNAQRFPEDVEFGDIVRGLPVEDGSCTLMYCSHVLEHLSLEDCRTALRNTHRLLREGGTFRLVLPDLEQLVADYRADASEEAALSFLKRTALGRERRPRSLKGFALEWLGSGQHLWMWDYPSLARELAEAGFRDIRRAQFGDSEEPAFKEVEVEDRWDCGLGIECRR